MGTSTYSSEQAFTDFEVGVVVIGTSSTMHAQSEPYLALPRDGHPPSSSRTRTQVPMVQLTAEQQHALDAILKGKNVFVRVGFTASWWRGRRGVEWAGRGLLFRLSPPLPAYLIMASL